MVEQKESQSGSALVVGIMCLVVLLVVVFAGLKVLRGLDEQKTQVTNNAPTAVQNASTSTGTAAADRVLWQWNGSSWQADGTPPACKDPIRFDVTPTDLSKVSAVLYPGQVRGGQYKPHGGFIARGAENESVSVDAIMDGWIVEGARYIEQGETQYMFRITNNCGISYRYDHLLELSPAFQSLAETLPAPKEDDSRTTRFQDPVFVKAGDKVATAVGFRGTKNTSFDLGIYDLRERNSAAREESYVTAHTDMVSQAAYAICWLENFNDTSNEQLQKLPGGDATTGKQSDYCKNT